MADFSDVHFLSANPTAPGSGPSFLNRIGTGNDTQAPAKMQPLTGLPSRQVGSASFGGSATYQPLIAAASQQYGLDPSLLARQLNQESGFNPHAVSSAGAIGIAQFMPGTAARYGVDPHDPTSSIEGAAHYMGDLTRQFGGNTGLALAGYNWGEGNVSRWLAAGADPDAMPAQTRNYVQSITGRPISDWLSAGQSRLYGLNS